MDTGERLAAYLSGDLDPDERTALEADLAGDPALRGRLDRIRATDHALAALREVEPPDGFGERLDQRVTSELDAVLGDELAVRRARRAAPGWLPAIGAAAALAVVVAGGIGLAGGLGSDDADTAAGDAGESRITADAGGGEAGAEMADDSAGAMVAPAVGPLLVDEGRTITSEDLAALAADPDVQAALSSDAVRSDPAAAALDFAALLGADATEQSARDEGTAAASETAAEDDGGADGGADVAQDTSAASPSGVQLLARGAVSDEDRADVATCLPALSEGATAPVVPLYAELGDDEDGTPVIVYVALSANVDGEYRRVEVWALDRDTCDLRLFRESEAQPVERNAP